MVVLGEFVAEAMELPLLLPLPFELADLVLVLVDVALVGTGTLPFEPPVQRAAPLESRPQVAPTGQQKDSPGHVTAVGSTQPGMGVQRRCGRSLSREHGADVPETVVHVEPKGQHPMSPLSAVKQLCGRGREGGMRNRMRVYQ